MYRRVVGQAYTRREYMGGVPHDRIVQYNMGDAKGKFDVEVQLLAKELCQIRHSALEAGRVAAGRVLLKGGTTNFHFRVNVYPHHVLRENKVATGAGADRISQGMRRAFGKAIGTAARVPVVSFTSRSASNVTTTFLSARIDTPVTPPTSTPATRTVSPGSNRETSLKTAVYDWR